MKIQMNNDFIKDYEGTKTIYEIISQENKKLAKKACAAVIDGQTVDLRSSLNQDTKLEILTFTEEEGQKAYHHTSAHILAQAVKRLYPQTKLAIGPAIKDGFYYDLQLEFSLSPANLAEIEAEMRQIIKENLPIETFVLPRDKALALMKQTGEPYKLELIQDLPPEEEIRFYQQGEFVDLCAGPHLLRTGQIGAVKLTTIAGAYWRGDEKNKMLTRIYGTSFPDQKALKDYLNKLEEARKRDHRKLGKELSLFTFMDEGPGFPFFLPQGMILKNTLINYWREVHEQEGYQEISTPIMLNQQLWETSGHWNHYKENMYTLKIDEEDYAVKPMNCPGGMLVYKSELRSYRDLPMRLGELGIVHRHEKSGALHGLMRVRCFTQDDAHIFMTPEQITGEIKNVVHLIDNVYNTFDFKYHVELSTRPTDSMGSDEDWNLATASLQKALEDLTIPYKINEGDGAFYGPKIDFHLEDSIGRTWQCGTIQLDFQLPQRFQAEYIGADGKKHQPITIHRVAFGSIERFIGILTEHFAGKFPLWLAPTQVKILTVTGKSNSYAKTIQSTLTARGIRTTLDERQEKIGYKIREARMQRIPYLLIIGEKEAETGTLSVRERTAGDIGTMTLSQFQQLLEEQIATKAR